MDARLKERLEKLAKRIEKLKQVEHDALFLEAHKKVLFSQLYLKAIGKNVSEKEANVYASQEWIEFINGYVEAQTAYNEAKRLYELNIQAYFAEQNSMKIDESAIRKGVS